MPRFQYTTPGANGEPRPGFIEADDENAAREQLDAQGLVPDSLELVDAGTYSRGEEDAPNDSPSSRPDPSTSRSDPSTQQTQAGHTNMTTDEHVEVLGQVGDLISAGIPLSAGLRTLCEEVPSRRLRAVFYRLSEKLDQGVSLEDAMNSESGDLPEWLAVVFTAGTKSGRLPECIQHFITFSRVRSGIRAKLVTCMVYPAILLAIGLVVSIGLCVCLIPEFRDIFEGFGVQLPVITRVVMEFSGYVEFAVAYWPLSLLAFWATVLAIWLISKHMFGDAGVRRFLYHVPLLGRLFKQSALAEFSQLLALLIEARMPMHEAMQLVGGAVRDPNLSEAAYRAAVCIEEGESFSNLRGVIREIPDELLRIPGWGSNDATLVESLRVSSELFALQSETSGRGFVGFVTPFSVIIAGCMIAITVIALFLPLVRLLNDLS